jgi:hypothetical protein
MIRKVLYACFVLCFLVACGMREEPEPLPTLDATRLFKTAVSMVTADFDITETHAPTQTPTLTRTPTPIPTLDRTRPIISTPTRELQCNKAAAGNPIDVTIPDDTKMMPGTTFSKTWRIENVGACTWTRLYSVIFFSGNSLGAQYTHYLQQPVNPGDLVDLTVDMVAPQTIGLYQSNWMLSDPDGNLFGIGPHGDAPFWVRIEVVQLLTPTPTLTPTITRTPVVRITGSAALENEDELDLDTATLNPPDDSEADLVYQYGETPTHQLMPVNDTKWAVFGDTQPSLADCINKTLIEESISFNQVPDGTYICYRTSESLRGWLLIEKFETGRLFVSFLTWAAP